MIFALAALIVSISYADQCAGALSCPACVALPLCGWCSVNVTYPDGSEGPQCAGFSATHSEPFTCSGVYSTDVCQSGYDCDTSTGVCYISPPGTGLPLDTCQRECHKSTNNVYLCNKTVKQCFSVPPGTPGSASLLVCEAICGLITSIAPGPVQMTYLCNASTWQCYPTTPGHGASLEVCQQECNSSNKEYLCNPATGTCDVVPPLTPGGMPLAQCEQVCGNITQPPIPPNPGPPPEYIGVWRGVEIQNGYDICEWDISVNQSTVVFVRFTPSNRTQWVGTPYHIPNSPKLEMWVVLTSGPDAGKTVRTIGDTSGASGPETRFATLAIGAIGGATPQSITSAMTDGVSRVIALSKCIPNEQFCVFAMPVVKRKAPVQRISSNRKVRGSLRENDACSQYGDACEDCISHEFCGWCSVPVTYADGTKGTQCAGFQGNASRFVCPGRYSTDSCEVGYICTSELKCVPTVPGDGMPQAVCLQTCVPTPPPAPRPKEYVCDLQTKQCTYCPNQDCPGMMPLTQCQELCPHPYPGPTPDIIGTWRGLYIQQQYSEGEVDFVMEPSGATVYKDGVFFYHATIISLGSDVMLFTIDKGANSGSTFGALYQMATQAEGMYWQMTMAIGGLNQTFPGDFNTPMYSHGMQEFNLAACLKSPCAFPNPSGLARIR